MATGFWAPTDGSANSDRFWSSEATALPLELFARFQRLIHEDSGMWIPPDKAAWLHTQISKRLREVGLITISQYYRYIASGLNADERAAFVDALRTSDACFFQGTEQFEFLGKRLFPRWQEEAAKRQRPHRIRAWVAGCAQSEDAYSLAMLLLKFFPVDLGWQCEVVASDSSTRLLAKARAGDWPLERAAEIPGDLLREFMIKDEGDENGRMKAAPEVRSVLRFHRVNLLDLRSPLSGVFDLIVCRHVLTYSAAESKRRIVNNLLRHLSPHGFVFAGGNDELASATDKLQEFVPTVYAEVNEQGRFRCDFRRCGSARQAGRD